MLSRPKIWSAYRHKIKEVQIINSSIVFILMVVSQMSKSAVVLQFKQMQYRVYKMSPTVRVVFSMVPELSNRCSFVGLDHLYKHIVQSSTCCSYRISYDMWKLIHTNDKILKFALSTSSFLLDS